MLLPLANKYLSPFEAAAKTVSLVTLIALLSTALKVNNSFPAVPWVVASATVVEETPDKCKPFVKPILPVAKLELTRLGVEPTVTL